MLRDEAQTHQVRSYSILIRVAKVDQKSVGLQINPEILCWQNQKQRKSEAGSEKVWHSQSAGVVAAGDQSSLEDVQKQVQLL